MSLKNKNKRGKSQSSREKRARNSELPYEEVKSNRRKNKKAQAIKLTGIGADDSEEGKY